MIFWTYSTISISSALSAFLLSYKALASAHSSSLAALPSWAAVKSLTAFSSLSSWKAMLDSTYLRSDLAVSKLCPILDLTESISAKRALYFSSSTPSFSLSSWREASKDWANSYILPMTASSLSLEKVEATWARDKIGLFPPILANSTIASSAGVSGAMVESLEMMSSMASKTLGPSACLLSKSALSYSLATLSSSSLSLKIAS